MRIKTHQKKIKVKEDYALSLSISYYRRGNQYRLVGGTFLELLCPNFWVAEAKKKPNKKKEQYFCSFYDSEKFAFWVKTWQYYWK